MRRAIVLASVMLAFAATPVLAKDDAAKAVDELVEIDGKKGVTIRADRAYFLMRNKGKWFVPVFMRVPTAGEVADFQVAKKAAFEKALPDLKKAREAILAKQRAAAAAKKDFDGDIPPEPTLENFDYHHAAVQNLQAINVGKALEKGKDDRLVLVEAIPGRYVLYGVGWASSLTTCLCLGTVGFEAKAGEITNLGEIQTDVAWRVSENPLLKADSGYGAGVNGHWVLPVIGMTPPDNKGSANPLLAGKAIVPAKLYAVGKFVGPPVFGINRLAPVAGVLAYDRGTVIDAATGQAVPNQF